MGEIATSNRQITMFYSSKSARAKQTLALAKAEGLAIEDIDILKIKLTETQIVELAERLHRDVVNLVNQVHPSYTSSFEHHNFSTNDWTKMIQHNPQSMKQPITLLGDTTILGVTPTDIIKI